MLQKKQAQKLASVTIICMVTTSVNTHAYHYPLFESGMKTDLQCGQLLYVEKI